MIYVPKHISNSKTKAPVAFDFILPCILYDNSLSLVKHVGEDKILTELLHFGQKFFRFMRSESKSEVRSADCHCRCGQDK